MLPNLPDLKHRQEIPSVLNEIYFHNKWESLLGNRYKHYGFWKKERKKTASVLTALDLTPGRALLPLGILNRIVHFRKGMRSIFFMLP